MMKNFTIFSSGACVNIHCLNCFSFFNGCKLLQFCMSYRFVAIVTVYVLFQSLIQALRYLGFNLAFSPGCFFVSHDVY